MSAITMESVSSAATAAIQYVTCPCMLQVYAALGSLWLLSKVFSVFSWFWLYFIRPSSSMTPYIGRKGSARWAVVTGASDGIGKGFAKVLASAGSNVVLISRTKSKLDELATELQNKYKVQIKVIAADFASADPAVYTNIQQGLSGLDIGVLVNNVGVNTQCVATLLQCTEKECNDMVEVNVNSMIKMTRLVLPSMASEANSKKKCLVLNLSSFTALFPVPYNAVYSGTKAFALAFSQALASEVPNVKVAAVCPYYVLSSMTGFKKPSLTVCTPEVLARATFAQVGSGVYLQPYWVHSIIAFGMSLIPAGIRSKIFLNQMKATRTRQLRRLAAQSKSQ